MRNTHASNMPSAAPVVRTAAELSYEDYLRISQSARAAARVARHEAGVAFWAALGASLNSVLRRVAAGAIGQHASVRLGAGHAVHRTGA